MKKILTLLVMFLATASILTAQTSKLSYQMIVRNQCETAAGAFDTNALVYNTNVTADIYILENTTSVYHVQQTAKTNMNGLLSFTLEDVVDQMKLVNIHWNAAKIVVQISDYCINDTMEVLPVPYALEVVARDSNLTTKKIVDYITNKLDEDAVNQMLNKYYGNDGLNDYVVDTVVNFIKAHPTAVKNLALYFIGKITAEDVQTAYDTVSEQVKEAVVGKLVDYAKNHKDQAVSLAVYYIDNATKEEATELLETAMGNANAKEIMKDVRDTVVNYLKAHPEYLKKGVKAVVNNVDKDELQDAQNWFKTNNPNVYDTLLTIFNDYLDTFLIKDFMIVSDSCRVKAGQPRINLCTMQADIANLKEYGFAYCPELGAATESNTSNHTMKCVVSNNIEKLILSTGTYEFKLSFPNSIRKDTAIAATFAINGTDTSFTATLPANCNGYQVKVTPYATNLKCRTRELYGEPLLVDYNHSCPSTGYPTIAKTSSETSATELGDNGGVKVSGKVDRCYEDQVTAVGFYVYDEAPTTSNTPIDTIDATQKLNRTTCTFDGVVTMKYCGQKVYVKSYVICSNTTTMSAENVSFTLRGPQLTITPDNATYLTNNTDDVVLTASATMTFGTNGKNALEITDDDISSGNVKNLGNGNYSATIEFIRGRAGQLAQTDSMIKRYFSKIGETSYTWTFPTVDVDKFSNGNEATARPIEAIPGDTSRYICQVSMNYLGATCSVKDTAGVVRGFTCGDKYRHQGSIYNTVDINGQCWTRENMRAKKDSVGNPITNYDNASSIIGTEGTAYYYTPSSSTGLDSLEAGLLYNYKAAAAVCPKGWHLPADSEWVALETYVHVQKNETDTFTDTLRCLAKYLVKVDRYWGVVQDQITVFADASDDYQFSACPAGSRQKDGLTTWFAGFWSSTSSNGVANWSDPDGYTGSKHFCRALNPIREKGGSRFLREDAKDYGAMSVRCVKNN